MNSDSSFINYKDQEPNGSSEIPDHLKEKIDIAIEFVDNTSSDWFLIKRVLINLFPLSDRTRFSRRNDFTKKQNLNLFDKAVINYWKEQTGVELYVNPEKLHDPKWKRRRRGWNLVELNKQRAEEAEQRKKREKKRKQMRLLRKRKKKEKLELLKQQKRQLRELKRLGRTTSKPRDSKTTTNS